MKFSEKNGTLYLEQGRMELYTPYEYGERVNSIDGDLFTVMGFLPYKYYAKATDKTPTKVGILNNPSMINTYPVDISRKVTDNIWGNKYKHSNENEYTVLHFEEGHRFMEKNIIMKLDNVTIFMDLLLAGKIDNNIPYTYLSQAWIKNMLMNDHDLQVPATTIDLVLYELCRYAGDKSKPFGMVYGKDPTIPPIAYTFATIREVCAANSVFTGLAFEDMNSMLDASLNMTKSEREQKISPIEQTIKF